jgi:hypothetical protein
MSIEEDISALIEWSKDKPQGTIISLDDDRELYVIEDGAAIKVATCVGGKWISINPRYHVYELEGRPAVEDRGRS